MVIVGRDRNGKLDIDKDGKFMKFLYGNEFGRLIARILACPFISKVSSLYLNSSLSNYMVKDFVVKNNIDLSVYDKSEFNSFNEFFTRIKKRENIHIDYNANSFISPCDGKLMVYKIGINSDFKIKNTYYTVSDLLNGDAISNEYKDGYILIFRLRPKDYHRYVYIDDGVKTRKRGEEKVHFEFGGSTIVLLVKKENVLIDEDIIKNSNEDVETLVECGMKIGNKISNNL